MLIVIYLSQFNSSCRVTVQADYHVLHLLISFEVQQKGLRERK